ncbi:MAG TPA: tRNA 2-selenouridine(34) synthase MnmH [Flavobacteriales bacterium]|nr:tRNA 2-selenouridine(34) synthase MnmH [Flavobacteriales bacterium]HMR25901.1 tRNA 2-selenouridine(34) synthase MnmH [Flavobacteriales bacterium]
MIRPLAPADLLEQADPVPLIDVRSPSEHTHGHIPGSTNLPLFSDAERSEVGTCYKQRGRDEAVLLGLRLVGPRLGDLVERARSIAPDGRIAVHCWRGGERSASVAWLLDKAGFSEVRTLRGGYKAFRRHTIERFARPWDLRVLGGYTGSGKTELLALLKELGEQVVDLEGLARHKGSVFGGLGLAGQPSTEHFENQLWEALGGLDLARPLWVEDESLMIGRVRIPDVFFARMRSADLYFVDMPMEDRVIRLVKEYGTTTVEELKEPVRRIEKRLGPQHCKAALEALDRGDLAEVARITLRYYDKAYLRSAGERDPAQVRTIQGRANDLSGLAQRLAEHVRAEHIP